MAMTREEARAVLDFWFGELSPEGLSDESHQRQWWTKDPALDARIRQRFGPTHGALQQGLPDDLRTPWCQLAAVVVLDQFSRNMFRDTPAMFESDPIARDLTRSLMESAGDRTLPLQPRVFAYMPLMHSEALEDQERCVELMRELHDDAPERAREVVASNVDFAIRHRDIVARFGRFPHRNAILGRESTPEEQVFLTQPGSSF